MIYICPFLLFVGVPLLQILVDVCQCVCFSRRFSSCILEHECAISVCVISVHWVCVCI
jgi:hypothetical protein